MNSLFSKLAVIFLIFFGEALFIYVEMLVAKSYNMADKSFLSVFLKALPFSIIFGSLIIAGYTLGLKAFQNIWIVSVTSITSIIIMEPVMAYFVTGQTPTRGALIGFILGITGLISALYVK
jgi:hypothetical protein